MPDAPRAAGPSREFWQERFASRHTPWDRGAVHPALDAWLATEPPRPGAHVLVPGCGAGHEVARLAAAGYRVTAVDYAPGAVELTRERLARQQLEAEVVEADLLAWSPAATLDAAWDQACLCALHPDRWTAYAARLARWLKPGGTLALLALQAERDGRHEGRIDGPPYHCDINAVRALFPAPDWTWRKPPYPVHVQRSGFIELKIVLERTAG